VLLLFLVLVLFDVRLFRPGWVISALGLGLVGQALLGTLASAWMAQVRLREVLLPLVLYPLLAPLLLAGVQITALASTGAPSEALQGWLGLLLALDALAVVLCPWLFSRVVS
jgi:heme exporter protein B